MPTIISPKANNWVDRGAAPGPTLERILAHLFDRRAEPDEPWLEEHATAVLGMVVADATEFQVAGYLKLLARDLGYERGAPPCVRTAATALWHAAKAALVRDLAERVLQGEVPANESTAEPLARWLAERLLTAEELAEYERAVREDDATDDAG